MHLAVDAANLLHDRRGIGRYARALLRDFYRRPDGEVQVTLLVPHAWPSLVRAKLSRTLGGMPAALHRRREVTQLHPDLVWYPWNGMTWVTPFPSVATVHDVWPFVAPAEDLRKRRNEQIPFRTTAARAVAIITDSAFSRAEIIKHLDVRPELVRVVHLGTEGALTQEDRRSKTQAPLLLDGASRYVLFVGESEPRKDLATLQAAMLQLPDALRMTTGLVIAGRPGPGLAARGRLRATRREGKATHMLHFERVASVPTLVTGEVSDPMLQALYAGASALAFPSRYEGFGLPVLEAMAHGVPVVAADAASVPEVAGDAALYFTPGDAGGLAGALARVMTDVGLAAQLRAAGIARASQMTWDRCATQTLQIFREAVEKGRK